MGAGFAHVLAERLAERVKRLVDAHRWNVAKHGHIGDMVLKGTARGLAAAAP
jgi:hypothetical protein